MKPHPIGIYLLCLILAKFCKAQNGYHYNRPTGRPFLPTSNDQIPNSNQKLSGTYQPQGSQKSYQNELSPSGYQYNRPSSRYSATPSPQSQTVGFPQPFRPNSGATSHELYTTTASPFTSNANPTTYQGTDGADFSGTTSNPFISVETPENRIMAITSSPLNSRGSLGVGTFTTMSSPLNTYSTSLTSTNGNYNYQTPAPSLTLNRDYGNYHPGFDTNTITGTGFNYGSNNQFGGSLSAQQPNSFGSKNSGNTAARNQLGPQGFNNFDSDTTGSLGTNSNYGGTAVTSNPISGNKTPVGSDHQKPETSNTESYHQNSATGLDSNNIYNQNFKLSDTASSNIGNTGISTSHEQYNENLIPQGTSSFGPGTVNKYGSNFHPEGLQTPRPSSFNVGNTGVSESNYAYEGHLGSQKPNNFNGGNSVIGGSNAGYGSNSGLIGSSLENVKNFGSDNGYLGLDNNQNSENINAANLGDLGPNNGYGNNFDILKPNNAVLESFATNRPNIFNSRNRGDQYHSNTFDGNLGQQKQNNAIEGSSGSQNPIYTSVGNQDSEKPINVLESATGFAGSSNTFGGSGELQGLGDTNNGNTGNTGPNFSATMRPQRPEDNGSDSNDDYSAIPGTPDLDYPTLSKIPFTKFNCNSQKYPGYYADIDARCQVFHICANGLKYDFICPNGTIFHQRYLVCVWWNQFECNSAESLYNVNENLYDHDKMGNLIANAAGVTGAQGPSVSYVPGSNLQGSSSNFNPSTGPPELPINFTPASGFEGPSIDYGSFSQTHSPSFNSGVLAGPQGSSTSTTSSSSYRGQLPNYETSNQQQGLIPNTGSSITPQGTSSSFGLSAGSPSSSDGFTSPPNYERPSSNYNFLSQPQFQSSNSGSSPGPPTQSIDYGALNNPQRSSNIYGTFSSPGRVATSESSSNAQGSPLTLGLSSDLRGSSANYPGYQQLRTSNDVKSFSRPQSLSGTYSSSSAPQNSITNSESSAPIQGITNKNKQPLLPQNLVNYNLSQGSQSLSNNFGISNRTPDLSGNFKPSTGLQEPGAYFRPTYSSQSGYESSESLPESSINLGQFGKPQDSISTNSPLTSLKESTTEFNLPSASQTLSENVNLWTGMSNSLNSYPQFSGFQKPSSDYGLPINSQGQPSNYNSLSSQSPHYQSLSELHVQPPNSGSSYNSPETSNSFSTPASSSSSSINFSTPSILQGRYTGLGQQSSLQKPSPSYGPPLGPSSNFGQQPHSSVFDSTRNPQRPFPGYSSTPSPSGQSLFGKPSVSQITSASFSPLSSEPSSNNGTSTYPSGSTFGSNFGGSQGSSPAPFTLAGTSQRLPTTYSPPQSATFNTQKPQSNYNPSRVYHQQSDFGIPASGYSGSLNTEQGQNYPTTVEFNRPFNAGNTEQPPNYSNAGSSSTAITSPDGFSLPLSSLSTAQPELYSTEPNVPSNTFNVQELSYPGYDKETTLYNNAPFSSSNQQVTKPNREYLPPFRKR